VDSLNGILDLQQKIGLKIKLIYSTNDFRNFQGLALNGFFAYYTIFQRIQIPDFSFFNRLKYPGFTAGKPRN